MNDHANLRATFDAAADLYHHVRPRYPKALFGAVESFARVEPPADILEIGPATGIATMPLAERGHRVTGIELGAELAQRLQANAADFPEVSVVHGSFDDWEPAEWAAFDLVVAATSWHWLDADTKFQRAQRHLRPSGTLAYWSAQHVVPTGGDTFFAEIQEVYDEIGESTPTDHVWLRPGELPEEVDEIRAPGLFEDIEVHHLDWEISYDADGYIDLLNTFSGHIAMEQWKRDRLYSEIRRRIAQRSDERIRRHWGVVLHLAHRKD